MATFSYVPDYGAARTIKPNVTVARFGDGYEQRIANGINNKPASWNLTFSIRTDTEAAAIDTFLTARGAVEAFDWTDPYGTAGRFVCRSWNRVKDRYNLNTITATFDQVFEA